MKTKMSNHCRLERTDRITFILLHSGVGNVVYEFARPDGRRMCLTDEGVLIVKAADDTIITMYYATIDQARFACEDLVMPRVVVRAIQRNIKRNYIRLQDLAVY